MIQLNKKYGSNALIAGGSEGLGAAFAHALAAQGMNLFLIARRPEQLENTANEINRKFPVRVKTVVCDLAADNSLEVASREIGDNQIDFLVYNAAKPYIGKFVSLDIEDQTEIAYVNVVSPLRFVHFFGQKMVERNCGAIILMSSLSGQHGSPYISTYAATKAFNQVLAEGLWFEWKSKKVDVLACVAGATATPNFIKSNPKPLEFIEPQVQSPEAVVRQCLKKLGRVPSFIPGNRNRFANFFMNKIFSRKTSIQVMGNSIKKMYDIPD